MPDPGALSAAISQITRTVGLGDYVLDTAALEKERFATVFADGTPLRYYVTDASGMMEIVDGVFTAPDSLSRPPGGLVLSNTGDYVDWPEGQRIVTPLVTGIPICDTPPTDGQVLAWDADAAEYCPIDVETGPDDDTCDMQDIYSGTSV